MIPIIHAGKHVTSYHLLTAVLSVLGAQEEAIKLPKASVDEFLDVLCALCSYIQSAILC